LGSAKQASDFETTADFLINYIQSTYEFGQDIGMALEDLSTFDPDPIKPIMQISTNSDDDIKTAENRQFEIEFKAEYDSWMKRKQIYINNTSKAYAFLWSQCAKSMQQKIEASKDYEGTIKNNPIELLKAIKQHALNYQEYRYEMSIILDSIRSVINLKQKEGESLVDYTRRFKTARDVLKSHIGGPLILTRFVENMGGYNATDQDIVNKCQEDAFTQFMAYTYISNSDFTKYGSLVKSLNSQHSLGNNQFPVTVTAATNALSNHPMDNRKKPPQQNPPNRERDHNNSNNNNNNDPPLNLSFALLEGKCYICGRAGHTSNKCRQKATIPQSEWAITKAKANHQSHLNQEQQQADQIEDNQSTTTNATATTTGTQRSNVAGWAGAHVQFSQSVEEMMKDGILLDN
jgi:hypothetical protein